MAKNQATTDLGALAQHDPILGYIFGTAYPAAVAVKERENRTAKWDELPEPPKELVSGEKTDQTTGEKKRIVDSQGNPVPPARLAFIKAKAKYRPAPNNANSNPVIFKKLATIMARVNMASGVRRGRGAGAKLDENDIAVVEQFDENAL